MTANIPLIRLTEARVHTRNCKTKSLDGLKSISAYSIEDQDILNQNLIQELEKEGGKILRIGGRLDYKGREYFFRVGYSQDMPTNFGSIELSNVSENASTIETDELYKKLMALFEKYFV